MEIKVRADGIGVGDGRFFRDICRMVEAIGRREEPLLEAVSSAPSEQRYVGDGRSVAHLASIAGVHRAQIVPQQSNSGRVVTEKVVITIGAESTPHEAIRTYNYPLHRVTDHRSGETMPLADVLAGVR